MPLINLRSNLTNNQFGNDRPGYGSSGLPYIQTKIPSAPFSTGLFNPIYRPGSTGVLDFPIRGGGPGDLAVGQQTFTLSSQIDTIRIKKFLEDKSRGPAFIQKQVGLQLTNPKIETGNTLFGFGQSAPIPGLLENTRVYNLGQNTLAQVAAMGSGAHAVRHGLVAFSPNQKNYYDIVNQQNVNNIAGTNRLVNLNALKMSTGVSPFVNPDNVIDIERVNTLGISLNRNLLFQYLGGPGSVYGAGATTIRRVVDTTRLRSRSAMTYDIIKAQKSQLGNANPEIKDFRRYFPGQPVWNKRDTVDYRFYVDKKDKLNKLYPFVFNNSIAPWEVDKENTDDLIKFVFEAISNDNPDFSTAIFFRAFLTSGITDNNTAQLNPFKYVGRGENFYTYQGFDRSIGFSFRIAAGSKDELRPIYNRLNTLVSQVYPDYSPSTKIMRAPLVRVTIGDYIYRMPGFLESVNIAVDNGSPWDIDDPTQLPQVLDVSISFKPIMSELPRRASFTSELLSRATNAGQETTTETYQIDTNVPQLIANNDNVILTNEVTQQSLTRLASPGEISAEIEALRRDELTAEELANQQNLLAEIERDIIPNIENEQSSTF